MNPQLERQQPLAAAKILPQTQLITSKGTAKQEGSAKASRKNIQKPNRAGSSVRHEFSDQLHEEPVSFDSLFLIMDFTPQDLQTVMRSVRNGTVLSEDHIVTLAYNMLCGLNFMH